eukprot:129173_1
MIKICFLAEHNIIEEYELFWTIEEYATAYPKYVTALNLVKQNKVKHSIKIMQSLIKSNPYNDIYHQLYANLLGIVFGNMNVNCQRERKFAFTLNPSNHNLLLYINTLKNSKQTRKLLHKALKKSNCIDLSIYDRGTTWTYRTRTNHSLTEVNGSRNMISLALAVQYATHHPFDLEKANRYCLGSMKCCKNDRVDYFLIRPIVTMKLLLLIGKYNNGIRICEETVIIRNNDKRCQFEALKVYGHLLLNIEEFRQASDKFFEAYDIAANQEQKLECCIGLLLCYSYLDQFKKANQWYKKGCFILKRDRNHEILGDVSIELYNAHTFLWYKQKLLDKRKINHKFSLKPEPIPAPHFVVGKYKSVVSQYSGYDGSYLFVYGLHAQYNHNLLVEAILTYYVVLNQYPTAITYWHMSIAFCELKYYAMSLKLLERAWKMSPEIKTIAMGYQFKKQILLSKMDKIYSCCICSSRNKLKACMGCCKLFYCSRKCQKIDWRKHHRKKCDRKFGLIMKVGKNYSPAAWKYDYKHLLKKFPKYISNNIVRWYYSDKTNDKHV